MERIYDSHRVKTGNLQKAQQKLTAIDKWHRNDKVTVEAVEKQS